VKGRVSWFGGPEHQGPRAAGTTAISREKLSRLNRRLDPSAKTLNRHAAYYYYAAMRVAYTPKKRGWWKNARLLVLNPANGRAVVVRPADWGPGPQTGRLIDVSPQAMKDLGVHTDDEVLVAFARPNAPLGPVK